MSHPREESLATPHSGGQTQTLILTAGQQTGHLHTVCKGREKVTPRRFKNEHAALDWCLAHGANLMLMRATDPSQN
jgi:hypothetical protein